jgi:hypothetical protein
MHLLKYLAIVLGLVAAVMLVVGFVGHGGVRRTSFASSALGFAAAVAIVAGLTYTPRPVCTALAGQWIAEEDACRDEFGGNGNNDPDNGMSFSD